MFPSDELRRVRDRLADLAASFDATAVSGEVAARLVEDAAAIEAMAATVKALAAARMAQTDVWREQGDRTPAHHLARTTGTSIARA